MAEKQSCRVISILALKYKKLKPAIYSVTRQMSTYILCAIEPNDFFELSGLSQGRYSACGKQLK